MKANLDSLLNREMNRKEFLAYAGTVVLGLIGVTRLVELLFQERAGRSQSPLAGDRAVQLNSYSSSRYSG